jgi:hypothetical protein
LPACENLPPEWKSLKSLGFALTEIHRGEALVSLFVHSFLLRESCVPWSRNRDQGMRTGHWQPPIRLVDIRAVLGEFRFVLSIARSPKVGVSTDVANNQKVTRLPVRTD